MRVTQSFFFFFITLVTFMGVIAQAQAGHRVKIKEGELNLQLDIADDGNVGIFGLPVTDNFIYDSNRARLYVMPANDGNAYYIPIAEIEDMAPEGDLYSPVDAPRDQALGFNTRTWGTDVYDEFCHRIKGSVQMADNLGLDVQDMKRISLGIGFVLAQDFAANPCSYYSVSSALASLVGFPMVIDRSSNGVTTEVMEVADDRTLKEIKLPEKAIYIDDAAYVNFLKRRLTTSALSSYLRTEQRLDSPRLKVKALQHLLSFPENQRGMGETVATKELFENTPRAKTMVIQDLNR